MKTARVRLCLLGFVFLLSPVPASALSTYELELDRWGIHNDGTHPSETTDGINAALSWARSQGIDVFKVPSGTYTIEKGETRNDPNAQINMVSNITFEAAPDAVFQKESSGIDGAALMKIGGGVRNTIIRGGTYKGDRYTHDYYNGAASWTPNTPYRVGTLVKKPGSDGGTWGYYYRASTSGTSGSTEPAWNWTVPSNDNGITWNPVARNAHDSGYGIIVNGDNITLDGITVQDFTGDGIATGWTGKLVSSIGPNSFSPGGVSRSGGLISDPGKRIIKHLPLTDPHFQHSREFQFINASNLGGLGHYTAYFYRADGAFISSIDTSVWNTPINWRTVEAPENAAYFHAVFPTTNIPANFYGEFWGQDTSRNLRIVNADVHHNRRNGLTIGGSKGITVENSKFHDQNGADPQSGIDVEAGYYALNDGMTFRNNQFFGNARYGLILYDGRNALAEGNHFGSHGIGLAISDPFSYATIQNNVWSGSSLYASNRATFIGNTMTGGQASFLGYDIKSERFAFHNTNVNAGGSKPFGQEWSNTTATYTCTSPSCPLFANNGNPATFDGLAVSGNFGGNAVGGVFKRVKVTNTPSVSPPPGVYTDCVFEGLPGGGGVTFNRGGDISLDNCRITGFKAGLESNALHGPPVKSFKMTNSTIENTGNAGAFYINQADDVHLENNVFKSMHLTQNGLVNVSIGNGYWGRTNPAKVKKLTMIANEVYSNLSTTKGIETIYAGSNAPSYRMEKNVLWNAKLHLKANDYKHFNMEHPLPPIR